MTFDDILASCIEALAQGVPIEECLQHHPAHAAALEPLLRMVTTLASEPNIRMSSSAFARGRAAVAAQTRQQGSQRGVPPVHARHRRAHTTRPQSQRTLAVGYAQNGSTQPYQRPSAKRARWQWGLPRLLQVAMVLLLIVGSTTLIRYTASSLPGTFFYPLKSTGEQVVGILMKAAGEEIAWHAGQAERRLDELSHLSQPQGPTAQTLTQAVDNHWNAVLAATRLLPADVRAAMLQPYLARLQQLEAQWETPQDDTVPAAVVTLHQMIATGEQVLNESQARDTQAEETQSAESVATASATYTATATPSPIATQTPLLQASATSVPTVAPVLVASDTPTQVPATLLPVFATPTPTLITTEPPPATPLPDIIVAIPQEETNDNPSNNQPDSQPDSGNTDHKDQKDTSEADQPTATETPLLPVSPTSEVELPTPVVTTTDAATGTTTPAVTPDTTRPDEGFEATATALATAMGTTIPSPVSTNIATRASTPIATVEEATATPEKNTEKNTPPATATAEAILPTPTKKAATATPAPATATSMSATATPKATKTPKATATPERDATEAPEEPVEATVSALSTTVATQLPTQRATATVVEATKTPRD